MEDSRHLPRTKYQKVLSTYQYRIEKHATKRPLARHVQLGILPLI
jgi:hypothetical protein